SGWRLTCCAAPQAMPPSRRIRKRRSPTELGRLLIETSGRPTATPVFLAGGYADRWFALRAGSGQRDHATVPHPSSPKPSFPNPSCPNTWLSTHGCERSDDAARSGPQEAAASHRNPTAQIIAAALGLFLGLFVLWAVVADNPSGVGSMAVVP